MKKTTQEIRFILMRRFEAATLTVRPQDDEEVLALLPENQFDTIRILADIISDKALDPAVRLFAAQYMIEYFAPPLFIKEGLSKLLALCSPPSPKRDPIIRGLVEALCMEGDCELPAFNPFEDTMANIARLAYYNPDTVKRWFWAAENAGETLSCSIGEEKLF